MIIIYEFFAQHPETAENLARFIFGMGGGYVAWAWIWKIQDGENDPAEKADRFELSNRMVVGGILGIMFGEMLSVMAGLNISGVPMTFLNEFTWVIAGFVGILGKSFVKKFLSMLASDVFDLHEKNKNKMLAGELSVSQVEKTKQSPVATTMPVAESKTEEVVKVASVVTAPVEEVKTEVGMTAPTNAVTEKLRGHIPDHVLNELPIVMDKFKINTPLQIAHFLAQCSHESGNFKFVRENLNYSAEGLQRIFPKYFPGDLENEYARQPEKIGNYVYANRMGNGAPETGDGFRYSGKGYVQLTGRNNYGAFSQSVGEDCVANPDLVATKYPLASAAWFWSTNNINALCKDDSIASVEAVTRRVNGGLNNIADRVAHFKEFNKVLTA